VPAPRYYDWTTVLSLTPHHALTQPAGPVVITVADGVGHAPHGPSNAVTEANVPTIDRLIAGPLASTLIAHGTAVGLPSDDDMGNSEVGHVAIGAGRIFAQGAKSVNQEIETPQMWDSPTWHALVRHGRKATLHLIGLHSDGNVHSHTDHLYAIVHHGAIQGATQCRLHILLDGRDVGPRSAQLYIETTEKVLAAVNADHNVDFGIASGGGRMTITMDRYGADWPMVKRGFDCHTHGVGRQFATAAEAVDAFYNESDSDLKPKGDQYLDSFIVAEDGVPIGAMADGDAVSLWNFRGDRAIEISQAYESTTFTDFDRVDHPDVFYAGLLQYDGDQQVPRHYLVGPPASDHTMGEYLADAGMRCFAISETKKFGHVTFFWNGNRSGYINESLETYVEIPVTMCRSTRHLPWRQPRSPMPLSNCCATVSLTGVGSTTPTVTWSDIPVTWTQPLNQWKCSTTPWHAWSGWLLMSLTPWSSSPLTMAMPTSCTRRRTAFVRLKPLTR
jgi:2,3-bisphosphoglycerate-independent phosphoglycerate mutase